MRVPTSSRRRLLLSGLLGAGTLALRAVASGLPASLLLDPRKALADLPPEPVRSKAQFVLLSASADGDPLGTNAPGTYENPRLLHPSDPRMSPVALSVGGRRTIASAPWARLGQSLERTQFWHTMTGTPVHGRQADVLSLMGATAEDEMLPSLLARELAPALGTLQSRPVCVGAVQPGEGLKFEGEALPVLPPMALRYALAPSREDLGLAALRDRTLADLADLYRTEASPAQRDYLDSLVTSQEQVRRLDQGLVEQLEKIVDNGPQSQLTAALVLVQMKVSPVVTIHLPFGGDNHADPGLAAETSQTLAALDTLERLLGTLRGLPAPGGGGTLADKVTLATLNVFGRTLAPPSPNGRHHNPDHQLTVVIGKPFTGRVVGGIGPVGDDFGALAIDSKTGEADVGGDVSAASTLASFGKTLMVGVGVDPSVVERQILRGNVVRSLLVRV